MFKSNDILKLGLAVTDYHSSNVKRSEVKKKLNALLHSRKTDTAIKDLKAYIDTVNGNAKNKAVLIVVMALLGRDLDLADELAKAIDKHGLTGVLYGGLKMLLDGKSESFGIKIRHENSSFKNKYEYLKRFPDFYYYDCVLPLMSAKVLGMIAPDKFEKLAFEDKTDLLLLNMLTYHLRITPSDDLIIKLMKSDSELKQNIGFTFLTDTAVGIINQCQQEKRNKERGLASNIDLSILENTLDGEIERCVDFLKKCPAQTSAALITNCVLYNRAYPVMFSRMLMSGEMQEEFRKQISNTGKIRVLEDLAHIVQIINDTPAVDIDKKRISKAKLYDTATDVFIEVVESGHGISSWDEKTESESKFIFSKLPRRCLEKISKYLEKKKETLMCSELDRLVRFKIYLEDVRKNDIISGLQSQIKINVYNKSFSEIIFI